MPNPEFTDNSMHCLFLIASHKSSSQARKDRVASLSCKFTDFYNFRRFLKEINRIKLSKGGRKQGKDGTKSGRESLPKSTAYLESAHKEGAGGGEESAGRGGGRMLQAREDVVKG